LKNKVDVWKRNYSLDHLQPLVRLIFHKISPKYLQQYLNWHVLKERIKSERDRNAAFTKQILGIGDLERFAEIRPSYEKLISTQC